MNGGFCRDFGSDLNCSCPAAYTGIGCQFEYDACAAGACQNGATCIDNGADYQCVCPPGELKTLEQFFQKELLSNSTTSSPTKNL
jgi:hypothetical protein